MATGDTIGDGKGIDAILPHFMLHIFADGAERRHKVEPSPVDAVERHQAIEIPEHQDLLPDPEPVHQVRGARDNLSSMPILPHNHHRFVFGHRRAYNLIINMIGYALIVIVELLLFTVIDTVGIIPAHPLRPALENETAIDALLARGFIWITDKNQVSGVSLSC